MTFLDFADDSFWTGFVLGVLVVLSVAGVVALAAFDGPRYAPRRRRRAYSRKR
jgi:hypothetical protein